jgi:hypothetical protein
MEHVLRVGVLGEDVVAHLRWLNGPFAESFARTLTTPLPVLDLADEGLAGGDDCHGRTGCATTALLRTLLERVKGSASDAVMQPFLERSPAFFLNIWMAASKLMLMAASGVEGSTVITAAGANGTEFGFQIAARPHEWFIAPALPPAVAANALGAAEPLGAIGDSAVVDILGLGAMTTVAAGGGPAIPAFIEGVDGISALLHESHPRMRRSRPRMIMSARRIVESGKAPVIGLGVLDRAGRLGRLTGGYYRPPHSLFERARASLA